ncbi:hypothetical protein AMR41_03080 [Hapalosiphon sp. MRB220]|nr:hypothetical protein AMR41_03080 [Hapalosiphon sp. MRB220]
MQLNFTHSIHKLTNGDRSLRLLTGQSLIKLKDNGEELATIQDIVASPKNLQSYQNWEDF